MEKVRHPIYVCYINETSVSFLDIFIFKVRTPRFSLTSGDLYLCFKLFPHLTTFYNSIFVNFFFVFSLNIQIKKKVRDILELRFVRLFLLELKLVFYQDLITYIEEVWTDFFVSFQQTALYLKSSTMSGFLNYKNVNDIFHKYNLSF